MTGWHLLTAKQTFNGAIGDRADHRVKCELKASCLVAHFRRCTDKCSFPCEVRSGFCRSCGCSDSVASRSRFFLVFGIFGLVFSVLGSTTFDRILVFGSKIFRFLLEPGAC